MSTTDPSSQPVPDSSATEASEDISLVVPVEDVVVHHLSEMEVGELLDLAEKQEKARRRQDKVNAIVATFVLHGVLFFAMSMVILSIPKPTVPSIIANASLDAPAETTVEMQMLDKPTVQPVDPMQLALPDIISAQGTSSFSLLSSDAVLTSDGVALASVDFAPSMAFGMSADAVPMTLFGQKMETEKLGVILDVSGSMAEYLPDVIREVDKNFRNTPIVYVTNALIQKSRSETELIEIVPDEVIPYYEDTEHRRHTPYWFLWHDLPRKAPQRYVDRLIQIFKTRKNSFLAYGGHNRVGKAIDYLSASGVESIYIFSDFEDYVEETILDDIGKHLGRKKIKGFLQPAETESPNLSLVDRYIAKRTFGRTFPPLVELIGPKKDERPTIALVRKPGLPDSSFVQYATPRDGIDAPKSIWHRPRTDWEEIGRVDLKEYTLVLYGPEARAEFFIKDKEGKYIQYPITFSYHSWKYIDDGRVQPWRWRKWLRNQEPPKWDGKELTWKMVLEDELKFDVYMYLNERGMNATYTADLPADGHGDNAYIYFRFPHLASERKDRYYGYDFPKDGLELEDIRRCVNPNTATFNLPNQHADQYGTEWKARGFEPGLNVRHYDTMIRALPDGIRDVVVQGPSFGIRKFHARTTSNKILLSGGSHRGDFEMWEGFFCHLVRSSATRTRFTRTEAIMIEIE